MQGTPKFTNEAVINPFKMHISSLLALFSTTLHPLFKSKRLF
jgi:hypothetical protein